MNKKFLKNRRGVIEAYCVSQIVWLCDSHWLSHIDCLKLSDDYNVCTVIRYFWVLLSSDPLSFTLGTLSLLVRSFTRYASSFLDSRESLASLSFFFFFSHVNHGRAEESHTDAHCAQIQILVQKLRSQMLILKKYLFRTFCCLIVIEFYCLVVVKAHFWRGNSNILYKTKIMWVFLSKLG